MSAGERGFTLIELLITVTIVVPLLVVTVAALNQGLVLTGESQAQINEGTSAQLVASLFSADVQSAESELLVDASCPGTPAPIEFGFRWWSLADDAEVGVDWWIEGEYLKRARCVVDATDVPVVVVVAAATEKLDVGCDTDALCSIEWTALATERRPVGEEGRTYGVTAARRLDR